MEVKPLEPMLGLCRQLGKIVAHAEGHDRKGDKKQSHDERIAL